MTYAIASERGRAHPRVSIVIPVYNEADRIGDCLRAIAAQTIRPYEVIVVDNNSTDGTVAVAAQFPFVTLVREPRQGVVYARRRGFDRAQGDVIGSIDADTDVTADWVQTVQEIFHKGDVGALAGTVRYRDIAWAGFISWVDLNLRRYFAWLYPEIMPLQGANMALRRDAWEAVRGELCTLPGIHEDMDLAVHLGELGRGAVFDERLRVTTGSRQCALDWREFWIYAAASPRSYAQHGLRARSMWCAAVLVVPLYPLLCILYRGYDRTRQKFSWLQLLRSDLAAHVNPVTFID